MSSLSQSGPARALAVLVLVITVAMSVSAKADGISGKMFFFKAQLLEQAQSDGRPVLVETYAAGCPVCWIQEGTIRELLKQPPYDAMTVFVIDANSNKEAMRMVGAQTRSTLIVYRGAREVGREVGMTRPDQITALLNRALWTTDIDPGGE